MTIEFEKQQNRYKASQQNFDQKCGNVGNGKYCKLNPLGFFLIKNLFFVFSGPPISTFM